MLDHKKIAMTDSFYKDCLSGGPGYIGSRIYLELLNCVVGETVFDNFCNSNTIALACVKLITGKKPRLVHGEICNNAAWESALNASVVMSVIHLAGLKSVCDLVKKSLADYKNYLADYITMRLLF